MTLRDYLRSSILEFIHPVPQHGLPRRSRPPYFRYENRNIELNSQRHRKIEIWERKQQLKRLRREEKQIQARDRLTRVVANACRIPKELIRS